MTLQTFLDDLYQTLADKQGQDPDTSYTARLLASGTPKIAQKVGEEGLEVALAAVQNDKAATVYELADLFYHVLVLCLNQGIHPDEIVAELQRRSQK
jgi:phosphoribosyl-ATP pyrophosphohydrolase